jgi:hypothetical protein
MTTQHATARGVHRCLPGECLRRYATPPAPPLRCGLTARQSGELERIAARYGALVWRLRHDATIAVAVLGDHPEPRDEVLLMVMRADGTLACLGHWTPLRDDGGSAPQSAQQEPPEPADEFASPHTSWSSPAHHAGVPAAAHL